MEVIVDRFEGEYAVVEIYIGMFVEIPKILVPDAREGDVVKIIVDKEKTSNRKEKVSKLVDDLFE
ncbi:MAG: DUF3006 domain-containing protein [Bacilli bacterium]|nr:DUF3006 domain-containing protein [Bacilli bacterium]